jgi:Flp pilus assembly protein TadD
MKVTLLHVGLLSLSIAIAMPAVAQDADESALDALDNIPKPPPVKVEAPGAAELRDAVRRIAQRPTDSYALTDAGYAAIKLGDYDAAYNFFNKANGLQPSDARIKAGLGIAQVRRENPFEALSLFDQAIKLGANERSFALDRGLAYDLLGNFERAQRDYTLAANFAPVDELTVRQAISLSLAGRKDDADRMLVPMLQKENPEAWRARAMMLAARGDAKEAGKIARGFLVDSDARRLDGYLRNMDRLTPAQQAAAMHFGHFPVGSDIGEDSNAVRTMASAQGVKPAPASGDARLIPSGQPLGTKTAAVKPVKAEKPKKPDKQDNKTGRSANGVATASAQQALDAAAKARVSTVSASALPPPESARPPVRISLPTLSKPQAAVLPVPQPQPSPAPAVAALPLPTKETPKDQAPQPVRTDTPVVKNIPDKQPEVRVANASPAATVATLPTPTPTPAPAPAPVLAQAPAILTAPVVNAPVSVAAPAALPQPAPASVQTASNTLPSTIPAEPKPAEPVPQNPLSIPQPTISTTPEPVKIAQNAPVQGPVAPGFELDPIGTNPPAPVNTDTVFVAPIPQPQPIVSLEPASQQPASQPVAIAEKPFDLGALVDSIEVPDEEKQPSVTPVDLKSIKVAAPKTDSETASKSGKQQNATPRIWVQIATGADAGVLGADYRRAAKKNSALFTNQAGWTAVWNKTKRLLVGPFADMKAAKKWEADFRKTGGQGFVWSSDKTAEITKLK